jgi:vacuolar-type H+-ATPase subunit I/STV1
MDDGTIVKKSVFYVMLVGEQLNNRVTKMCAHFDATVYHTPHTRAEFDHMISQLETEKADTIAVLRRTKANVISILGKLASRSNGTNPSRFD